MTAARAPVLLLVPAMAALYLTVSACDYDVEPYEPQSASADYAGICVDPRTYLRVDDALCQGASEEFTTPPGHRDGDTMLVFSGGYGWYYYGSGTTVPPVGSRASGGTFTTPKGTTIQRGGFGIRANGSSGGA